MEKATFVLINLNTQRGGEFIKTLEEAIVAQTVRILVPKAHPDT